MTEALAIDWRAAEDREAGRLHPISPLEGEMPGRAEGGDGALGVWPQPVFSFAIVHEQNCATISRRLIGSGAFYRRCLPCGTCLSGADFHILFNIQAGVRHEHGVQSGQLL